MHVEMTGQRHPLLLIPGTLGPWASDFPLQIGWFAVRGFEVVALDPRAYGRSRPPERHFPLEPEWS